MNFCSLLCVVFSYFAIVYAKNCKVKSVGPNVTLPDELLSLTDFDTYVVNNTLGEFFYLMPSPAIYDPYINYYIAIEKESDGHYVEKTFGETPGSNSICKRSESLFNTNVTANKASFYNESKQSLTVFWSTDPSSYILLFRCTSSSDDVEKCLLANSFIGLLLPGTPFKIPMEDIVKDLCEATGIKFGTDSFDTFFTFGEAKLCAAEDES